MKRFIDILKTRDQKIFRSTVGMLGNHTKYRRNFHKNLAVPRMDENHDFYLKVIYN